MARGVNKVILVGFASSRKELRYTPSGAAVCNFSIATNESWTDRQSGQRQERTEWHNIVAFNRLAEIANEYIEKGTQVYIEGRLQTKKWQDASGNDQYKTEIVAEVVTLLGGGSEQRNAGERQHQQSQNQQSQNQQSQNQQPQNQRHQNQHPQPQSQRHQNQQRQAPQHSSNQQRQQPQTPPMEVAGDYDSFDDQIPF